MLKNVDTGVLDVVFEDAGPADGWPAAARSQSPLPSSLEAMVAGLGIFGAGLHAVGSVV